MRSKMNSGRKKTAIYRNFIRGPKIISGAAAGTVWLCVFYLVFWWPWVANIAACFFAGVLAGLFADWLGNALTRLRFQIWALNCRHVHPDDFDFFLERIDAEKLEEMVAWDFEGIFKEE
jgi:hypothetical protein